MLYDVEGTIKAIGDIQKFPSGFTKRDFVIEREDERFDKDLALTCKKDRCSLLDELRCGERVKVSFGISSREYNGRYYTDVTALKIDRLDSGSRPEEDYQASRPAESGSSAPMVTGEDVKDDDDMPF